MPSCWKRDCMSRRRFSRLHKAPGLRRRFILAPGASPFQRGSEIKIMWLWARRLARRRACSGHPG
jgi:hypothetical protein